MRHVTQRHSADDKPLSEPVLLILTSLSDQPRHGYALLKDIEALSGGRVRMSTGTLFGAIRRLLENRWIEPVDLDDTSRDKQGYRLTPTGRRQLQVEIDRMKYLTKTATARLKARRT
jgi:DNA-binding PadR family transcriptional regulator